MLCSHDLGFLGNDASSNYNALQVKIDKRFSNGLQFLTHYTLARSMNYTDNYYAVDPPSLMDQTISPAPMSGS